jgi:hypothetical protein
VTPCIIGAYIFTDVDLVDVRRALDDMAKENSVELLAATPVTDAEWELLPYSFVIPE